MMRFWLGVVAVFAVPCSFAAATTRPQHPAAHRAAVRPAAANWLRTIAPTQDGGMRMGNPDAPVKLVEYGARTCPICARFDKEGLPALEKGYIATGKLSYEFHDFPVHGVIDIAPILLGHCVSTAQFFPLLDAMMQNQQTLIGRQQQVPEADGERLQNSKPGEVATYLGKFYGYTDLVVSRGLPAAKAQACLTDEAAINTIANRMKAASDLGVTGTPTFFINGTKADKVYTWEALEPLLQAAGAK
jgi:protein-disulfide isomerase